MAVSPSEPTLAARLDAYCGLTAESLTLADAGDWDALIECIARRDLIEPELVAAWQLAAPVPEPLRQQLNEAYQQSQRLETLMRLRQVEIDGLVSSGRQQVRINRAYFS
ncbi:hypothetical protein GCM10027202_32470 [Microvirgula curvata]|uniref:Flagellar protein FliT n=1 Tax=Microvirgula aerodenitrificans TaxID=57480 RepID=A0A2S0P6Y5_9NEIS|nr:MULTISPECIES: flagellar protein FliT [Microvirgula]AVY93160.1 hypothetical protein DAI18_03240 [Microvirgula aerodenitrificans]RAS19648.1 protein FliT [Microvirgula sp. AG722]